MRATDSGSRHGRLLRGPSGHKDAIDVPAPIAESTHSADPLPFDVSDEHWAKPVPIEPNLLMAIINAAFGQKIVDVPYSMRKTHTHLHFKPIDLGGGVEMAEWAVWFTKSGHGCAPL